jgi:hypothetical protein
VILEVATTMLFSVVEVREYQVKKKYLLFLKLIPKLFVS